MWVNVGARYKKDGTDVKTKKALKDANRTDPASVTLYVTDYGLSMYGGKTFTLDNLPDDVKFSVCGPNPYTSRKWYATVARGRNGQVTIT